MLTVKVPMDREQKGHMQWVVHSVAYFFRLVKNLKYTTPQGSNPFRTLAATSLSCNVVRTPSVPEAHTTCPTVQTPGRHLAGPPRSLERTYSCVTVSSPAAGTRCLSIGCSGQVCHVADALTIPVYLHSLPWVYSCVSLCFTTGCLSRSGSGSTKRADGGRGNCASWKRSTTSKGIDLTASRCRRHKLTMITQAALYTDITISHQTSCKNAMRSLHVHFCRCVCGSR